MPCRLDYQPLFDALEGALAPLRPLVPLDWAGTCRHGDFPRWNQAVQSLPDLEPLSCELRTALRIGEAGQLDVPDLERLRSTLMHLHPWRKGPLELFGLKIDTEWRSDWKWDRVLPHITPLAGRRVLDIGCGNGYHCWRMAGQGAAMVLGVEPSVLFNLQYWVVRKYLPSVAVYLLPNKLEDLPAKLSAFDTVFSMGVLYHRREPMDHLRELLDCLRPGGELVLETLITDGADLFPEAGTRYARMGNVWNVPATATLVRWVESAGFREVRIVDTNRTGTDEQRSTDWMQFESLAQALDPQNPAVTVEGHPAPVRALLVARAPE
jgi:tRNA (mo5U34)-methyltransferase